VTIPPISTKRTIFWTQKRLRHMTLEIQVLAWDRFKPVNGIPTLPSWLLDLQRQYVYKQRIKHLHIFPSTQNSYDSSSLFRKEHRSLLSPYTDSPFQSEIILLMPYKLLMNLSLISWHSCGLFCVQWDHLCYFCWYWWNWWPSLFKLSFHIPPHLGISFHSCLEPCRLIKITSLTCSPYWY
jgi:hypothetical protein